VKALMPDMKMTGLAGTPMAMGVIVLPENATPPDRNGLMKSKALSS